MKRVASIGAVVVLLGVAVGAYLLLGRAPRGPEQPIAFPHPVHVVDAGMECAYCHFSAEWAPGAGIPSTQLCVGCHVPGSGVIPPEEAQLGFATESEELQELLGYWQRGEAVPWVRVHNLPRHAHFPHDAHLNVGLECSTCHGPVEEMDVVYRFSSLRMGWCMDCHRGRTELSPAEEEAVQERSGFIRRLAARAEAGADVEGVRMNFPNQRATVDCTACHY